MGNYFSKKLDKDPFINKSKLEVQKLEYKLNILCTRQAKIYSDILKLKLESEEIDLMTRKIGQDIEYFSRDIPIETDRKKVNIL